MAFDILPKLVKPIHASSPKFDGVWSCQAQTDWSGPAQVGSAQSLSECSRALQGLRLGADPPRALARRAARAAPWASHCGPAGSRTRLARAAVCGETRRSLQFYWFTAAIRSAAPTRPPTRVGQAQALGPVWDLRAGTMSAGFDACAASASAEFSAPRFPGARF